MASAAAAKMKSGATGCMGCVGKQASGFTTFLLRGNVVDLAVAVVVGGALLAVVTALVADLITPLLAAIGGQPDFSTLSFTINGSKFMYGHFINSLLTFCIICFVIYFLIVAPMNALLKRYFPKKAMVECPECESKIPATAHRCSACGIAVTPKVDTIKDSNDEIVVPMNKTF